jgi:hypothetical protein
MAETAKADKYLLLFDKSDSAGTFFSYKATCKEMHKDLIAVKLGSKKKADILEAYRRSLVFTMKQGETFCLNLGRTEPDLKTEWKAENVFEADRIFDNDEWHRHKNYMSIVRDDENVSVKGEKGLYSMDRAWKLVILCTYVDDEHMERIINSLPCIESFRIMVVDKPTSEDFSCNAGNIIAAEALKDRAEVGAYIRKFSSYEDDHLNQLDHYSSWLFPKFRKQ